MDRQGKEKVRVEVEGNLNASTGVFVTEYRGLSVEDVTNLRLELRKCDAKFKVYKNRIVKKGIESEATDYEGLNKDLNGPVGIVYSSGDAASAAKVILKFSKDHEAFKVKCGVVDKSLVSADQLKALADLPSKEVLLGQIVGSLVSPHRGMVSVLAGVSRQLVQVINAIKDTKKD